MDRVHIESIEIEGFRGIRETSKPIKLNKLTTIIGRNGSCKTTLLEALYILSSKLMIPSELYPNNLFSKVHKPPSLKHLLYNYDTTSKLLINYRLRINNKYSTTYSISAGIDDLPYTLDSQYFLYPKAGGGEYSFEVGIGFRRIEKPIPISSIIILYNEYFMNSIEKYIIDNWDVVESRGLHKRVVDKYINSSLPGKIYTELTIRPDGVTIRREVLLNREVIPKYIRVKDLGDGIYRTLMNILYIEFVNPDIILWDDFGSYMHPSLIESTLKYIIHSVAADEKQYIITTHSIDTLYYLHKVIEETSSFDPDWLSLLILYKDKADILDYELIDYSGFDDLMSSGIDPRLLAKKLSM